MPATKRTRKTFPASVSLDVHKYLTSLVRQKMNASQEVDCAVKATPGFKKFMKEKSE